jgi:hypothetical protein
MVITERVVPSDEASQGVPAPSGVSVARFTGFDAAGRFLVVFGDTDPPVCAWSTVGLTAADVGAEVAVGFERDGAGRLVILGRLRESTAAAPREAMVQVNGQRVTVRADQDLELRCGSASIVLTQAGKVLINGSYVSSRSRGANRIRGAYVDIN